MSKSIHSHDYNYLSLNEHHCQGFKKQAVMQPAEKLAKIRQFRTDLLLAIVSVAEERAD